MNAIQTPLPLAASEDKREESHRARKKRLRLEGMGKREVGRNESIPTQKDMDRLWAKVDVKTDKECWPWRAAKTKGGYGVFYVAGIQGLATRTVFINHTGALIGEWHILHKCDNPPCCNPGHLFKGTPKENRMDIKSKGRQMPAGRGIKHRFAKLNESQVIEVRALRNSGKTLREIGDKFGISNNNIHAICTFKTWKHLICS